MRVWIFGSSGYVGREVALRLRSDGYDVRCPSRRSLDRLELGSDVVVNCAGVSGSPNVDWCEDHAYDTVLGNTIFPIDLARRSDGHFIHVGSGCIFFGENQREGSGGAWGESDPANPRTVYTRSKYAADLGLLALRENVTILRPRLVFSGEPGPRNMLTKLSKYSRVIDVVNSVTSVGELARAISFFVKERVPGVFHATHEGTISHREIVGLYRKHVNPQHPNVEFISEGELNAKAERSSVRLLSSLPQVSFLSRFRLFEEHAFSAVERSMIEYGKASS